ncbi:hypothetical protein IE81DRAFT_321022 [Ceraceosorus guamensis]|uniref:Uncharacterized protein n=1 Tax=Ceraceosorus guamensis TaxID=1522189 RepID=A0A316W6I4_9BASI|nr:hypothetical protein IE81DRAFT_321022 [Ceraceosorus guamensis]PWN44708.1 hypothetical protein IE81DRAFT_321022 [Ceraceosorus guamensis]
MRDTDEWKLSKFWNAPSRSLLHACRSPRLPLLHVAALFTTTAGLSPLLYLGPPRRESANKPRRQIVNISGQGSIEGVSFVSLFAATPGVRGPESCFQKA